MSIETKSPTRRPSATPDGHWLSTLGFVTTHEPGISRAWRLDQAAGYLLITDVGGYDLPDVGAPASAYLFTRADDLVEFAEFLADSRALHRWVLAARRRLARMAREERRLPD